MRTFRNLHEDEIECRISEIYKGGNGLSLLLYKTARTDALLLDELFGAECWQNDYKVIDGKLFCGIGIKHADLPEWVWKWDCGSESNVEAEKGQASDAFKRAGFKWGIGAELYSSPRIYIPSDKCNITGDGQKFKCYDTFSVEKIAYDDTQNISGLAIKNDRTRQVCFVWSKGQPDSRNQSEQQTTQQPKTASSVIPAVKNCSECGIEIADNVCSFSLSKYGAPLCRACQDKRKK